jgi:hypothetical protein
MDKTISEETLTLIGRILKASELRDQGKINMADTIIEDVKKSIPNIQDPEERWIVEDFLKTFYKEK